MKRAFRELPSILLKNNRDFSSESKIINPKPNDFIPSDSNSLNRYFQDFMRQITQRVEKIDEKVEKIDGKFEKISVEAALQKERLNLVNSEMVQAVHKEVTYVVKNQDLVTNTTLEKALNHRFLEQEKLFDLKLDAMGSKLINEFNKSKKDAQRWGAALGVAGASLVLGFFQYKESLKHVKEEEAIAQSDSARHVAKKT